MANEVIIIYPDGERRAVSIDNITVTELTYPMICSGFLPDGTICGVPMSPFIGASSRRSGYFYEASRSTPHRPGCPCARGRKKTIVEQLDRRASGVSSESIYDSINNKKKKTRTLPQQKKDFGNPENPSNLPIDTNTPTRPDDSHKHIDIRPRNPRSFEEYYLLLSTLKITDYYSDRRVFDLILDERTVEAYRRFPLPTNNPLVIEYAGREPTV